MVVIKKIFFFISLLALSVGLVGALLNTKDFSFTASFDELSKLNFPNILDDFKKILDIGGGLSIFNSTEVQWYEYITAIMSWFTAILVFPIVLIVDLCKTLAVGFSVISIILGL